MQSMDRNTVIGFVLLAILLFAYLFISTKSSQELQVQKKNYEDSLARVEALKKTPVTAKVDSIAKAPENLRDTTAIGQALNGSEQLITVENDLLKIVFSNKGGQPKTVELKKYNTWEKRPVKLVDNNSSKLSYAINLPNQSAQVSDLFFQAGKLTSSDSNQVVSFTMPGNNGESITHSFTIHPNSYLIDFDIRLNGANKLLTQNSLNLLWNVEVMKKETDAKYERTQSEICFVEDGDYDYENVLSEKEQKFEKPIHWVSVKQQFFNTTLIAKNKLEKGEIKWTHPTEDSVPLIVSTNAVFNSKVSGNDATVPLQFYYGPNDYKTLRAVGVDRMDKIVNLGQGFYAFVRPINQYIVIPVFDFFKKFIGSFGVVIALLTLFIRLLTSPLVYSSYLSGAKMKALRPEIDLIKKKYPDDQQQFGMEQMKLFREAGVNPLGGCIPALLQIPIFFALYSFFNGNVALRGESFLWAKDLSVYDTILNFGFHIPLLGDHISLFTLLAVVTSFLISLYGMANTPDQNNPALKYMPYIFPFMLLFMFNGLPSALTWYYTVSNVITLVLQWVIQNYIINHEKILVQLQENRKKPKSKSKWQERLEQMQETQKRVQETQTKNKGK